MHLILYYLLNKNRHSQFAHLKATNHVAPLQTLFDCNIWTSLLNKQLN